MDIESQIGSLVLFAVGAILVAFLLGLILIPISVGVWNVRDWWVRRSISRQREREGRTEDTASVS